MKRHIFLTGNRGIGKSTVIRRFLEAAGVAVKAGGFLTVGRELPGGASTVHIVRAADPQPDESNIVMFRPPGSGNRNARVFPEIHTEIFDTAGSALLRERAGRSLLVMDELGFAESEAALFQRTVFETLDGNIPVLGVTRAQDTEFLNAVRSHPAVRSVVVTEENRDVIPELLLLGLRAGGR